jgi:hypothetical protein
MLSFNSYLLLLLLLTNVFALFGGLKVITLPGFCGCDPKAAP